MIENGIPIPAPLNLGRPQSGLSKELRLLEVGQSVLVKDKKQSSVVNYGGKVAQETGYKFTTRVVDGGVRIWRIK